MGNVFDTLAEAYDGWYDSQEGRAIFEAERDCLLLLHGGPFDSWLEVGVGTGRFAHALGIARGIDPSRKALEIASRRGVDACVGTAEQLPFGRDSFGGVLMALTLCFVSDAAQSLEQSLRVLRPGGRLLLGIVPAESDWGREYDAKAARGHPIYAHARFRTAAQLVGLARRAGFVFRASAGTLFWKPGEAAEPEPEITTPPGPGAGFVGLLFLKNGGKRA